MPYDLLIKNGVLIDGSGQPRYRADVAVRHGRIASIGRIREAAREVIDADGMVVAPGFVDGHTHMDAQVFWDPLGTCSCWHGDHQRRHGQLRLHAGAVRGRPTRHMVVRNLRARRGHLGRGDGGRHPLELDDVPRVPRHAWTSLPKGINYAGYLGHCALRTYVMGERAFEQAATEDDLRAMERELRDAIRSRRDGLHHDALADPRDARRPAGRQPAGHVGRGAAPGGRDGRAERGHLRAGRRGRRPRAERSRPRSASTTCVCATWPSTPGARSPGACSAGWSAREVWRHYMKLLDETAAAGGRMFAQVHSRGLNVLLSFKTQMPFDNLPDLEAVPRAAACRAAAAPARSRDQAHAGRGHARDARQARARDRGATVPLRVDLPVRPGAGPAPDGGRDRHGARRRPGRGHDRPGAREELRPLLRASGGQRDAGRRAGDDAQPARGGDLLRLRRARLADRATPRCRPTC